MEKIGGLAKGRSPRISDFFDIKKIPKRRNYGITSQIRRLALSIPTNIVEGYSRRGDKELANFINIRLGSLAETKYLLHFAHKLGYMEDNEYFEINNDYEELGKMLWRFYETVRK